MPCGRPAAASFFVAQLDEGRALRASLPDATIFVLNGLPAGAEDEVARRRADPGPQPSGRARPLRQPRRTARRAPAGRAADRHRHVPPGFRPGAARARSTPDLLAPLELVLVMSHLVVAEEPDNPLNELQRERFERLRRLLPAAPASLANSSGIFLGGASTTTSAGRASRSTASTRRPAVPTRWRRW